MTRSNNDSSSLMLCMNIINTITHLLIGAIACTAIIFANYQSATVSLKQHIYLCVTGYIILMSQAVLAMNPYTGWSSSFKLQQKKNIHWIMQVVGSILAIAGSAIRIANFNTHFQSAHAAFGILALAFTCLSLVGGVVNLFPNNMGVNPNIIKIIHAFFGILTIFCAFFCLMFGFDHLLYRGFMTDLNANMLIAFTVLALVGVLTPASMSLLRRMRR